VTSDHDGRAQTAKLAAMITKPFILAEKKSLITA